MLNNGIDISGSKILIVDDSEICVEIMKDHLQNNGFQTRCSLNSIEVEEILNEFSPDLIILDVNMPGISGLEVARQIRNKPEIADIPIIFITGEIDTDTILKCFQLGNDYTAKPIRSCELLTRVNVALTSSKLKQKAKAYESELEESKALFRQIINESPAQVFVIDCKGRFVQINQKMSETVNIPIKAVFNKTIEEIEADGYNVEILRSLIQGSLEDTRPSFEVQYRNMQRTYWALCKRVHFIHQNGLCTLGINLDISSLKIAENEKSELQVRLAQSQKMEAVGTMAGGIAHDFNNLLAVMMGFTEMVLNDPQVNDDHADSLNEVLLAGRTARDLIKQILDFSRKPKIEFEKLDIVNVINNSARSAESTAGIKCLLKTQYNSVEIDGNSTQLGQLFTNLFTNACHAMPDGGTITTELGSGHGTCRNCGEKLEGNFISIKVTDTGTGLNEADKSRIFEPYYTTKDIGEGTGLGLAVVHGVVSHHNGHICVETKYGSGCTFHISIPMKNSDLADGEKVCKTEKIAEKA